MVAIGPEGKERCPCWPALGTGVGAWGTVARESCPGLAVSLGSLSRVPGPLGLPGHVSAILGKSETPLETQSPHLPALIEWS